jgi:DNA-binding transcriptional MocR family regulator
VAIDEYGILPEALELALRTRLQALVITPRAQNPTGAALDETRAAALRDVLRAAPDVVLVEDDHQGPISGAAGYTLSTGRRHWAVVRSVAKSMGPDLRLAFVGGDAETVARVEGRQALGPGWVSHLLQRIVIELFRAPDVQELLRTAEAVYADRRQAVISALAAAGIQASGRSGFNVWVKVADETGLVSRLLEQRWAVAPGARYRLHSAPAVRVTCASLPLPMADALAHAFATALQPPRRSRAA